MKITRRQANLLKCLNEYPNITLKMISNRLDISMQTVKTELQNLNELLDSFEIFVQLPQGNKLNIDGIENITKMIRFAETSLEFSIENQILLILVLNKNFITFQEIADKLYVSKSLIEKQMPILFKKYETELQSVRHYGVKYCSSQMERTQLFSKLIEMYICGLDFKLELKQFHDNHFMIMNYFKEGQVEKSIRAIKFIQTQNDFSFTDESIKKLFLYILFFIYYNDDKEDVAGTDVFVKLIKEQLNIGLYVDFVEQLNEMLSLGFNEKKKYYICYLLLSLRKQRVLDNRDIILEMSSFVQEILRKIQEYMEIDFFSDKPLCEGLALHIYATVLRKDIVKLFDEFYSLNDIKREYPLGFEMSTITADLIKDKFDYLVSENEMIYLTLHFQAAIERMNTGIRKVKAIIVCHYGVAAASLISMKIERLVPEIEIIKICSLQEFLKLEEVSWDLVLTTEILPSSKIPIIYLTPDLKENQLKNINDFLDKKKVNNIILEKILEADILNIKYAKSVEEIIYKMINPLVESNYVSIDYYMSVIKREKISSTNMGNISIPHGNPDLVKQTKLVISKLDKPVKWNDSYVKYVFLFAFSKKMLKENQNVFSTFYRKLATPELEEYLADVGTISDKDFKKNLINLLRK